MNKLYFIFGLFIAFTSCKSKEVVVDDGRPNAVAMKAKIAEMDDSLKIYFEEIMDNKRMSLPVGSIQKAIDLHYNFYIAFPKDEYAPVCLDKMHQLYLQDQSFGKSVKICDTLLKHYPDYKNRNEVYYSAATTYDYMLNDTLNAHKFYNLLLNSPKTSKALKEEIRIRLPYLGKSPEEMAEEISKEVSGILGK